MRRLVLALAASILVLGPVVGQEFQQTTVDCSGSPGVTGYVSIEAMNEDMMRELAQIGGGKQPEESYRFILCPNTVFDASNGTLVPLLNGAMFLCGTDGSRANQCELNGGATQVSIEDTLLDGYTVNRIAFMGITHREFTGAGIGGGASSNTTVILDQVDFTVSSKRW